MSGSKHNCSLESLQKILNQRWPGEYKVFGNTPYHTETIIVQVIGVDNYKIVKRYDKNYIALQAMITPGWDPLKSDDKMHLFATTQTGEDSTRPLMKKFIELLHSAEPLGELFNISVKRQLVAARKLYIKLK